MTLNPLGRARTAEARRVILSEQAVAELDRHAATAGGQGLRGLADRAAAAGAHLTIHNRDADVDGDGEGDADAGPAARLALSARNPDQVRARQSDGEVLVPPSLISKRVHFPSMSTSMA